MCVFTHTHVALARSSLIGGPTSLGGPGRVRGGAEIPDDVKNTDIPNQRTWASVFSKASRTASARFTPNASFSNWGTIGRLGELIFMLENLIKWDFHVMGPLNIDIWRQHIDNVPQDEISRYVAVSIFWHTPIIYVAVVCRCIPWCSLPHPFSSTGYRSDTVHVTSNLLWCFLPLYSG